MRGDYPAERCFMQLATLTTALLHISGENPVATSAFFLARKWLQCTKFSWCIHWLEVMEERTKSSNNSTLLLKRLLERFNSLERKVKRVKEKEAPAQALPRWRSQLGVMVMLQPRRGTWARMNATIITAPGQGAQTRADKDNGRMTNCCDWRSPRHH